MNILNKQWKYINEGNVHIVLQIVDTSYVIRLIKDDTHKKIDLIRKSLDFVNLLMLPLLCKDKAYTEEIIFLTRDEVNVLSRKLLKVRPKHRLHKTTISQHAFRAPNLTIIDPNITNYCIEIKPKEGFLAKSLHNYSKCYYCLKQILKLSEKQITKISEYCPLDLYSGKRERMKIALLNLINNPQNNIKMFKNCVIIYDEHSHYGDFENIINATILSSVNVFLDLIIDILLGDGSSDIEVQETDKPVINPRQNCFEEKSLPQSSFLYNLLYLQQLSDNLNIDTTTVNDDYITDIIDEIKSKKMDLKFLQNRNQYFESAEHLHMAMISSVVKDCSIMITFTEQPYEGCPSILFAGKKMAYRIAITDVEPKSVKTLIKRIKTEEKFKEIIEKCNGIQSNKIQPHSETRQKQLAAWEELIIEYLKASKQYIIDIRESQNTPLFSNPSINRRLSQDAILTILEDMARCGLAAPTDKSKSVWEVYWHSLDEWGNMIYNWVSANGLNNSVCTLFELREGETTEGEEFHGLDINILTKALKTLEVKGKCELMEFDDNQGVKFF